MEMLRALRVEHLPELYDIYMASDNVLTTCAREYLEALEASKALATEEWLRQRSDQEQEMYHRRQAQQKGQSTQIHAHTQTEMS